MSAAPELPEYHIKDLTPSKLRSAVLDHGSLLIRQAVPQSVMEPLAKEVANMLDHFDGIPPDTIRSELEYDEQSRRQQWREILNDGVHYNYDLIVASKGRANMFDPINLSPLKQLAMDAFPEAAIERNYITNTRRMFPKTTEGVYSDVPLEPHIDAMFHQHDVFGINFWTPLTDAGEFRPGIAIIPQKITRTRDMMEYNPKGYEPREGDFAHMSKFRTEKLKPEQLKEAGLLERFVRPKMQPGDVLAFTNWTVHATSVLPTMTGPRTSIEVRVFLREKSAPSRYIWPEGLAAETAQATAPPVAAIAPKAEPAPAPKQPEPVAAAAQPEARRPQKFRVN